ncbi:MAG: hypothetical protein NT172_12440, partial [Planctomycetota bacterium]|nr:hypothetical protein [Planctomycetota bacterium]
KNDSSNLEVILSLFLNAFAICLFSPGLIKDLERALKNCQNQHGTTNKPGYFKSNDTLPGVTPFQGELES